jgi:hypothetical protein
MWAQQSVPQTPVPQKPPVAKKNVAKKKKKVTAKLQEPAVAPPVPAQIMPPIPATLMNSAPVKPNVTMEGGLLTIDAPNSNLSDVLNGIRRATGAAIDGATPNERVAVRLGPGNPRQVIAALLHGTPYDYVILGAQDRQDVVTRIMLTPAGEGAAMGTQPPQNARSQQARQRPEPPSDNGNPEEAPAQPETDVDSEHAAEPPPQQNPNQPQTKTPEQLMRELQQVEQPRQ